GRGERPRSLLRSCWPAASGAGRDGGCRSQRIGLSLGTVPRRGARQGEFRMADARTGSLAAAAEQPRLMGGAIGLAGLLFQSITHMAPAAGVIFSVQYMASQAGAALGLGFILATVACLLTALCMKEVVQKV